MVLTPLCRPWSMLHGILCVVPSPFRHNILFLDTLHNFYAHPCYFQQSNTNASWLKFVHIRTCSTLDQLLVSKFERWQMTIINKPVHEISNNVICATSKASDQPAHTRSLIRAFASRLSIL